MRIMTKRLRLELRGFRCKVALYLSHVRIKLNLMSNLKRNPFEFHA